MITPQHGMLRIRKQSKQIKQSSGVLRIRKQSRPDQVPGRRPKTLTVVPILPIP